MPALTHEECCDQLRMAARAFANHALTPEEWAERVRVILAERFPDDFSLRIATRRLSTAMEISSRMSTPPGTPPHALVGSVKWDLGLGAARGGS
jgi:hypothetical protein